MQDNYIKIKGGLGNQLFQYAFSKHIEEITGRKSILDISWFENGNRNFELPEILSSSFISTTEKKKYILPELFIEKLHQLKIMCNRYDGYWQKIDYAKYIDSSILKPEFTNKRIINRDYKVIHYRGGDFFSSNAHIILSKTYYENSFKDLKIKEIYLITDDLPSFERMKVNFKYIHVPCNSTEAFSYIFNSSGGIASNSTFCWWPIYLSKNPNWIFSKYWLKNIDFVDSNLRIEGAILSEF